MLFGSVDDVAQKPSTSAHGTNDQSTTQEDEGPSLSAVDTDYECITIESDLSKLKLDEDSEQAMKGLRGQRVYEVLFIENSSQNDRYLAPVQIFAISEYSQEDINNLNKILQYDRLIFEKIQEAQKKEQENRKLNIARKVVKPMNESGGIQINTDSFHPSGHPVPGIGAPISAQDLKLQLIQRTQARLTKFGLANLRLYDVFTLRKVAIPDADIEQSPLLERARLALSIQNQMTEGDLQIERELLTLMKDMALEEVLNPNEVPNSAVFDN